MSTELRYGLPYFLDVSNYRLAGSEYTGSEYNDMYGRMTLSWTAKESDETNTVFYAHEKTRDHQLRGPSVTVRFGPGNTLGTVNVGRQGPKDMNEYLSIVNEGEGSRLRRFFASDGKEYRWGWRKVEGEEWTCTNSDVVVVADYHLKRKGDALDSPLTGGAMLTITEDFGHIAPELLATVSIMRYIVLHDIK